MVHTASTGAAAPGEAPRCVIILYQNMWAWLYPGVMEHLRRLHGTRFIMLASNDDLEAKCRAACKERDRIITFDDIWREGGLAEPDPEAEIARAQRNEEKFNVTYMRDIVQQMRALSATYLTHAPASPIASAADTDFPGFLAQMNSAFAFFERLFAEEGVDLVLARPDIGVPGNACVNIALTRGIGVTFCRAVRYQDFLTWAMGPYSDHYWAESVYGELEEAEPTPHEELVPPGGSDLMWEKAAKQYSLKTTIWKLGFETVDYSIFFLRDLRSWHFPKRVSYWATLRQILFAYRAARIIDGMSVTSIDTICERPYILFLLPKEPEYSVQSQCHEFAHTFTTLQHLALCLPIGYRLVIKEHSTVGDRRLGFYRDLLRLPNVVLAHRLTRGIDLAARAAAVATFTGTTGLEATLLGKQVITFSNHVEYRFLPNVQYVESFNDLPRIVRQALRPRTDDEIDRIRRSGTRFRNAIPLMSFLATDTPFLFGKGESIPAEHMERAVETLLENFRFQKRRNAVKIEAAS